MVISFKCLLLKNNPELWMSTLKLKTNFEKACQLICYFFPRKRNWVLSLNRLLWNNCDRLWIAATNLFQLVVKSVVRWSGIRDLCQQCGFRNSSAKRDRARSHGSGAWPQSIQRRPHDTACKHVATSKVVVRFQNNQRAKPAYPSRAANTRDRHESQPSRSTQRMKDVAAIGPNDWTIDRKCAVRFRPFAREANCFSKK